MAYSQAFRADPVRELAFGSMGASYVAIGSGFDHPVRQVLVSNFTNATLMFSFDGIQDHFPLLTNSSIFIDIGSNRIDQSGWFASIGTVIHVKNIGTPSSGSVYVSAFYGKGD